LAKKETTKSKKLNDVVGIDFGSTSTKLVRIRRSGSGFSLVDAGVMPAFDLKEGAVPQKFSLSKKLCAPYAAACLTGTSDHVRFMFIPSKLHDAKSIQSRVGKSLGLGNDYRIGFSIVEKGKDGQDHKVLAAAMPKLEVQAARKLFSSSRPSLISLEIAGLSALNSFSHTDAVKNTDGAVCYLEAGAEATMISFFLNGELRLVRKFDYGSIYIQQRIQDVLSIGEEEAINVLFEDATPLFEQSLDPIGSLLQEISISKKFVERNEHATIARVFASGGLSYSPYWNYIMGQVMGVEIEIWNPFSANGMKSIPNGIEGVESMFTPAVGAAIALLKTE
jgi:Tfp pilus assembly PilM family ATPase